MKIALMGPGALGCLVCSSLTRGMHSQDELYMLDHNPERATRLQKQGIIYENKDTVEHYQVLTSSSPQHFGQVEVIFLCVKSYDIASALIFGKPLFSPNTLLVFLQNGIAHLDAVYSPPEGTAVYGSTTEGATLLTPGHVRHAGKGITHLGMIDQSSPSNQAALEQIQTRLMAGGMETILTKNIKNRLWDKLFINVGINALTAIWNCKNGQILTNNSAKALMQKAIAEAVTIARQLGIESENDPFQVSLGICKSTADNVSSMLQDVRAKKTTEIDAINGVIVQEGKRLGIATPANIELFEKVKHLEREY